MKRDDLTEALMQAWGRLDPEDGAKFFGQFARAALRLDALALRAWCRRRLKFPPLAMPLLNIELTAGDIALLAAQSKSKWP